MADNSQRKLTELGQELRTQADIVRQLQSTVQEYQRLKQLKEETALTDARALSDINKQINSWKEINRSVDKVSEQLQEARGALASMSKEAAKARKEFDKEVESIAEITDNFKELEGLQHSITNQYGKQSNEAKRMNAVIDQTKVMTSSIGEFLKENLDIEGDQREAILSTLNAYKKFPATLNKLQKQKDRGKITEDELNESVIKLAEHWEDVSSQINFSDKKLKGLKRTIKSMGRFTMSEAAAANASSQSRKDADEKKELRNMAQSTLLDAIPAANDMKELLGSKNRLQAAAAGAAVGAGVAQLITGYKPEFIPDKIAFLGQSMYMTDIAKAQADLKVFEAEFGKNLKFDGKQSQELQKYGKGLVYMARATSDFNYQMQGLTAAFDAASKTAFMGGGLGSVEYNTGQLELAGVNAQTIAGAMNTLSSGANTGNKSIGARMAVFAKWSGVSEGNLANIVGAYRRLTGASGKDALSMTYAAAKEADKAGVNPNDILNDMAEASSKLYSFNIRNEASFSRQVLELRKMGTSFKFAEAAKGGVLNYRETIMNQQKLSAMINRRVDFTEALALAAGGNYAAAYKNIQESGTLEAVRQGGLFAQDQFSKIFGMSIDEFSNMQYETSKSSSLASTLTGQNAGFLGRNSAAELSKQQTDATIAMTKAITDAKFDQYIDVAKTTDQTYRQLFFRLQRLEAHQSYMEDLFKNILTAVLSGAGLYFGQKFFGGPKGPANTNAPIGQTGVQRYIKANSGNIVPEFTPNGKVNPNFTFARNMSKNATFTDASGNVVAEGGGGYGNYFKNGGFKQNFTTSLKPKGFGGGLGVLMTGADMYGRYASGQSGLQSVVSPLAGWAGSAALMSAAAPASAQLATVPGYGWVAAGALQLGAGALGYFGGSKLSDATFAAFDGSQTTDPLMRSANDPTGKYQTMGDAALDKGFQREPKWLKDKLAAEGADIPMSVPAGDPLLIAIENIEALVASIAGAGAGTTKLLLDGKDITNSVKTYMNNNKTTEQGQAFKAAIGK
jgi:uncharacterized coiled-coil DUF342 family protein